MMMHHPAPPLLGMLQHNPKVCCACCCLHHCCWDSLAVIRNCDTTSPACSSVNPKLPAINPPLLASSFYYQGGRRSSWPKGLFTIPPTSSSQRCLPYEPRCCHLPCPLCHILQTFGRKCFSLVLTNKKKASYRRQGLTSQSGNVFK